jgi:hypothetical protein
MSDVLDLTILDSGSDDHAVALARCGSDCAVAQLPFGKELKEMTESRDWIEAVRCSAGSGYLQGPLRIGRGTDSG